MPTHPTGLNDEDVMISLQQTRAPAAAPHRSDDVLTGLRSPRKHLPCRLLYDARGAELFDQICALDEYYLTRSELALLDRHLPQIAAAIGPEACVIEPGSGAGTKTRMLLTALERALEYVPIDVNAEQLVHTAAAMRKSFPELAVHPMCGDYTGAIRLPSAQLPTRRTVVFFAGSTIGNFEPEDACRFLTRWAAVTDPNAMILIGADSNTDPESLVRAYDDADGVTAAFNLNVLAHLNRTHAATFDLEAFMHRAVWNAAKSRIEMHLVSRQRQRVTVSGERIGFERGEAIVTEHCYKHPPAVFEALLRRSGWRVHQAFVDPRGRLRLWLAMRTPLVG
jgi:dimethylhistidine N-methyltransferase